MPLTELPPLEFDGGGFRLSLFSPGRESLSIPISLSASPASTAQASVETPTAAASEPDESSRLDEDESDMRLLEHDEPDTADDHDHVSIREPEPELELEYDLDSEAEADLPPDEPGIPTHPIPSMQAAFAESLHEVTHGGAELKPRLRALDAKGRRDRLVDQEPDADPYDMTWRYRPGQQQHELLKLIAQISFGVYLLLNGMANDNAQVVSILQGHIDEVDEFLEVTLEDLAEASKDLNVRIDHLELPLSNMVAFEEMLEDRNFRAEILEGNEKIEHVLARTNVVIKQWDDDVEAGLRCSTSFMSWLNGQRDAQWRTERPDLGDIFDAMKGNADGWLNAFDEMNSRAQDINSLIIKLMTIVAEMEKTAGEVSRKTWASIRPFTSPNGDSTSSISSPPSTRSHTKSANRVSIRSGSVSTVQMYKTRTIQEDVFEDEDEDDFPLPGAAPLLPPPRNSARLSTRPPMHSISSPQLRLDTRAISPEQDNGDDEEPLYLLQPRTYTPLSPEPLPSPMLMAAPTFQPQPDERHSQSVPLQKRTSLRQRVSLKTNPPDAIRIPPRNFEAPPRPSPGYTTPRTSDSHQTSDSAYGSDMESYHFRQHSNGGSHSDLSPPNRPSLMPSPRSDHQQYYRPVRASPHSPLQQRPHTAVPSDATKRPSAYYPHHQRNQPSRMGGMSTLSTVTTATYQDRPKTPGAMTQGSGKRLKKKKSAFGWLKKAFTMDDDEKAAYEARKVAQNQNGYYTESDPVFLDGRRIR